jgi:hypothetical protein
VGNSLGIAVVTAALQDVVQAAVEEAVPGAIVRVGPPRLAASGEAEVSITLHRLAPDPQLRNDLPTRSPDGASASAPQAALRIHYLIAFTGDRPFDAEIMLGKVVSALHAAPILSVAELERAGRADGRFPGLRAADRSAQLEPLRLTPEYLSIDELAQVWTMFPATPHRPSLHYVAGPVLIDSDRATPTLPARAIHREEL